MRILAQQRSAARRVLPKLASVTLTLALPLAVVSGAAAQSAPSDPAKSTAGAVKMPLPKQTIDALRNRATPPAGTDLVIDQIEWRYTPPKSISGVPPLFGAVGTFVGKVAKAGSRAIAGGGSEEPPATRVLEGPALRVTIRNVGAERWASEGRLVAYVKMGTPEELDARPSDATKRAGVRVVEDVRPFGHIVALPPFSGEREIAFSLAAGERRTIDVPLRGVREQKLLAMSIDKFYTARVEIQAKGETQPTNNGADFVYRIDYAGQALEPSTRARRTDPAARGTVEVVAPPRK